MEPGSDALGLVGTTIADKYVVEAVVGEGGFATVYRAMHAVWKRPVAVKVFKALGEVAIQERQRLLDDFVQEGALLADLSERSPAICQARDIGMLTAPRGEAVPYMVLEWLEGGPLEGVLESERSQGLPLRSLSQTVELLDPIAEALALAHKKGIAHRDVKPANVFVVGEPRGEDVSVKLLDFGIAKVVQGAQKMGFGKTAGHITSFTPAYGAPEQFNRAYGPTGPWTDVFALALVAVEVLTGRAPIVGDTIVQLAYAASDPNTRPTPRTFGALVPDEVEAVFQRALAVKPDERYPTAGEFWSALRAAAMGHPLTGTSAEREPLAPVSPYARTMGAATAATALGPLASGPPRAAIPTASTSTAAPKSAAPVVGGVVAAVIVAGAAGVFALRATVPARGGGVASASGAGQGASAPLASSVTPVVEAVPACPEGMTRIPGGKFFMGSDDRADDESEHPAHQVTLAPYCMDTTEVTVAAYKACSDRGECRRAPRENDWEGISPAAHKLYDPLCNVREPEARARHPINCVDWDLADAFCKAVGKRLPTEAEWEFATRGSDGRKYPWGDEPPTDGSFLNACGKECVAWGRKNPDPDNVLASMYPVDDGFATTAPVGSFRKGASPFGLQDVVGNVWEWVSDWYAPYGAETVSDPKGAATGTERVLRGGAWNGSDPAWVRPTYRFKSRPALRSHGIGFRCAR